MIFLQAQHAAMAFLVAAVAETHYPRAVGSLHLPNADAEEKMPPGLSVCVENAASAWEGRRRQLCLSSSDRTVHCTPLSLPQVRSPPATDNKFSN